MNRAKMDNDRRKYGQNFWDWTLNIFLFSKGGRNNNAVTWNSTVPTFQVISNYLIEVSCYLFRCSFFEIFYSRLAKKKKKIRMNSLLSLYINFLIFPRTLIKRPKNSTSTVKYLNLISTHYIVQNYSKEKKQYNQNI